MHICQEARCNAPLRDLQERHFRTKPSKEDQGGQQKDQSNKRKMGEVERENNDMQMMKKMLTGLADSLKQIHQSQEQLKNQQDEIFHHIRNFQHTNNHIQ